MAKLYLKFLSNNFSRMFGDLTPEFALFWDFASLYQHPRTAEEDTLFLPGLRASNIWYGHEKTSFPGHSLLIPWPFPGSPARSLMLLCCLPRYGHEQAYCWMQTELPSGFDAQMAAAGLATNYIDSGWCARSHPWPHPHPGT